MSWQLTAYAVPTLLATAVALALAVYTAGVLRRQEAEPTLLLVLAVTAAVAIWTGFSALKLLRTDLATKLLFYRLLHVGAALLPPLIALFALAYTGRDRWLRPGVLGAAFAAPVAFLGLLFANPTNAVIAGTELATDPVVTLRVADGPGFLILMAYSFLLVGCSLALVGYETLQVGRSYYPQAGWLALGVLAPVLFGALTAAAVTPFHSGINLVPTSGAVSALALSVLVFRYRLFDLPPLAYTTAMRYSPDALFVLDDEERIVHANPTGETVLEAAGGAIDGPMRSPFPEFDPTADAEAIIDVAPKAGPVTYFQAFAEPLVRGGRSVGWVAVFRDVTDEYRQQKRLRRQTEQLETFAATVTHDLRNPLTVAQANLELAQQDCEDDRLAKAAVAHDRMVEIIEDVLTLARQGKRIDELEPVALGRVAERSWTTVDTETATLALDADLTLEADRTMLQHVFDNLFRNAIDHGLKATGTDVDDTAERRSPARSLQAQDNETEYGDSALTVRVGTLPGGFFIEDDGPGIPAANRESVLEAGYTTSKEGTGYGLEIVRSVVDAHGWELTVTEGRDGGARFEITGVT